MIPSSWFARVPALLVVFASLLIPGLGVAAPADWANLDIGTVGTAGTGSYDSGTGNYTLQGAGADIGGTSDNFHFAYQTLSGDGYILARIDSLANTNSSAKAGVMIRETLAANSKSVLATVTPGAGAGMLWRVSAGGGTSQLLTAGLQVPRWLKLERRGNVLTGSQSSDGVTWSVIQRVAIPMASDVYVGLAACSRTGALTTVAASQIQSGEVDASVALPWPWVENTVGVPLDPGVAMFDGSYALADLGADIWGTADKMKFVSQPLIGDGALVIRISSADSSDSSSRFGLVMRKGLDASAQSVFFGVSTAKSLMFLSRPTQGGSSALIGTATTVTVPLWLKLERSGGVFTASKSSDGVAWIQYGNTTLDAGPVLEVGVAYSNHSSSTWAVGVGDGLKLTTPFDTDGNGLDDAWEMLHFGGIGVDPQADPDGDGLTNAQEWELGNDPLSANQPGQHPVLTLVGGDGQSGLAGTTLQQPLAVKVTDSLGGVPLPNIPVQMAVVQGAGLLGDSPGAVTVNLLSNANGVAQSYFTLPVFGGLNIVSASVGGRQQQGSVTFALDALVGEPPLLFETTDIGSPFALPSQVSFQDGVFTLKGATVSKNAGTADKSTFVWRNMNGDGYILAKVSLVDTANASAQAGVMMRVSEDPASANTAMLITPGSGTAFQWRDTLGGSTGSTRKTGVTSPIWLLLRRSGDVMTGFYSADGQTWTGGGTRTIALGSTIKVGLALGTLTTVYNSATFESLRMEALAPAPWVAADIGTLNATAVDDYYSGSVFVRAGGTDITGGTDSFHYIYQPLAGDGRMVVRVASQQAVTASAKSAIMIRESLAANSRHITLMMDPTNGITLRSRAQAGGTTVSLGSIASKVAPYWLRLDRFGGRLDAYASPDGSAWTLVGSAAFNPGATPLVGIAACSNNASLHTQTLFDNIQLSLGDGPRGWNAGYYSDVNFGALQAYRRDEVIDFTWPAGQAPASGVPADGYSVRWEGDVIPGYSEDYVFSVLSQGSVRVTVNGQVVVDAWAPHSLAEATGHVLLQANQSAHVVVEYAKISGDGRIQFRWSSASQADEAVPFTAVHPIDSDDDRMPDAWEISHGLDPNNPADASMDPDGDGVTNLQEYLLGGDPHSADDRLRGAAIMERWNGISGTAVADLTRSSKFHGVPDARGAIMSLETVQNSGDSYGLRIRGYIVPPADGAYRFWVAADDSAEFWLSPDDSPFTRSKVARVTLGATGYRNYAARLEQHSRPITLQAGHYYYFEVVYKEASGADYLSIAWTRPGVTTPQVITGDFLATYGGNADDLDTDGLPDAWEAAHGLNDTGLPPASRGAYGDADGDRLINLLECQAETDPRSADTDGDGYDDYMETLAGSDPTAVSDLGLRPWQLADVGLVNGPTLANRIGDDAYQLAGTGSGVALHKADSLRFLYRQVSGDFEFTTRVVRPASSPIGYAGVAVRSSLDPHAATLTLLQDEKGGDHVFLRNVVGSDIIELPGFTPSFASETNSIAGYWFKIRRQSDLVSLFYSLDGLSWMLADSKILPLDQACLVGMAVCHNIGTATGNLDTELAVRQFKNVSLITDYAAPATGGGIPTDATVTPVETINGSAGVTVDGQWAASGNDIVSQLFTGKLDYAFTVPADGLYRLDFTAISTSNPTTSTLFPVEISVDGQFVARIDLVLPLGEEGIARIVAPWLKAGAHTVRIFYDNTLSYHPLTIRSLAVDQLGGADTDGNGRADWVDVRLQAANTIAVSGSVNLYASPACLDGKARFRSFLQLTADGDPVTVSPAPGYGWYANVPLDETAPVEVSANFENGASIQSLSLSWSPINLLDLPDDLPGATITIRKGDSLRFSVLPPGVTGGGATMVVSTDASDPVIYELADGAGPVVHTFTAPGTYTVTSVCSGSSDVGVFTVEVIEGSFASDPVVGLNNAAITWDNPGIFADSLIETDQGLLLVKQSDLPAGGTRFSLGSANVDDSYVVARLGEGGPILAHATVRSLRAATVSDTAMDVLTTYPDGSQLIGVPIIVNYLDDDTRVVIDIVVQGVTFEDGTLSKTFTKADFDAYGRLYLKFLYPKGLAGSICHRVEVYQGSTSLGQF